MDSKVIDETSIEVEQVHLGQGYKGIYNRFFKRLLDLVFAFVFLLILIPFYLIISIFIIIESGMPVLYKAERGGYKGKTFKIYKFRTMVKDADKIGGGTTALNDSRITKVGKFLRKTKLDEIAQLINIIKGDMSFVGPRPELIQYTSQYEDDEKLIFKVRPGITDYSSIKFINLDEMVGNQNADEYYEKYILKEKNQLRIKYACEVSVKTDLKLFFYTVYRVINKAVRYLIKTIKR